MKDSLRPADELKKMRDEMSRMLDNVWNKSKNLLKIEQPAVDIENRKNDFIIRADLPGVERKDIKVNATSNHVEIQAERTSEKRMANKNFYKRERAYGGFYRSFALPEMVDPKKMKSSFGNGTLEITLPKMKQLKARTPKKKKQAR